MAVKNTRSPIHSRESSTGASTSTRSAEARAEQLRQKIQNADGDSSQRLGDLMTLCKDVNTWVDWMALHQINETVGSAYVADALETALIGDLQQQIPDQPSDAELLALRRVCQRLPSGSTRDDLVKRFAPAIEQRIDRLMSACMEDSATPKLRWAARDLLEDWQGLAPKGPLLHETIDFALSLPKLAPTPPEPAPLAQQIERCITQHGNNPHRLVRELLALPRTSPIGQGTTTWQNWLNLYHVCGFLEDSQVQELGPVFDAVVAGFSSDEWKKAGQFHQALPATEPQCTSLRNAVADVLSKRPARVSGYGPAPHDGYSILLDPTTDIWPHVARQFLPSTELAGPPKQSVAIFLRHLPDVAAMSRTNRYFHRKVGPLLPLWAAYLMKHSSWFTQKTSGADPDLRWTKLPLANFVQWMNTCGEALGAAHDQDHLISLLSAIVGGASSTDMGGQLDRLWKVYGHAPEGPRSPYDQLPRLLARLATRAPFQGTARFSAADESVHRWLMKTIEDTRETEPVWVELGIGFLAMTLVIERKSVQWQSYFWEPVSCWRKPILDSKLAHRPEAGQGMTGIASVLLSTPAHANTGDPVPATPKQVSDALRFLRQFSQDYPLRGRLLTALQILQELASADRLTSPQRDLLNECLHNDAAHRAPKTLTLV